MDKILEIKKLNVKLLKNDKEILKNISLYVKNEEFCGVIGESGAGKTTLINSITKFLPEKEFGIEGEIIYKYENTLDNKHISIIPQDSLNSLNPYEKILAQLMETYKFHNKKNESEKIYEILYHMLEEMGFENIEQVLDSYPDQLSGGMRQRIVIALALCTRARLIIADEPTTSLDMINQYKFVNFLKKICIEKKITLIYITHDIRLLSKICDRIIVMKDGEIVEEGEIPYIFENAKNDYTKLLLECREL